VGGRHGVEDVASQHLGLAVALDVHHRRRPGHGDRFFHRADFQVGVDARREVRLQFDAVPLDGRKAGQAESQRVQARPKVLDSIDAIGIGGRGADCSSSDGAAWTSGTPGRTAPVVSFTMPVNALCARAAVGSASTKANATTDITIFLVMPVLLGVSLEYFVSQYLEVSAATYI
jgi:hypothetical protein